MDVNPLSPGHALVVPKQEMAELHMLSAESAAALGAALPLVAGAIMQATSAAAYNILQNNGALAHQAVMHVHFHIIPRIGSAGLGVGWNSGTLSASDASELVTNMQAALHA